jgi:hypothetical protein
MNAILATNENPPPSYTQANLEMAFIEAFLSGKGYHLKDLHLLPTGIAKGLMVGACIYASNKLAEIEARSNLMNDLHGNADAKFFSSI